MTSTNPSLGHNENAPILFSRSYTSRRGGLQFPLLLHTSDTYLGASTFASSNCRWSKFCMITKGHAEYLRNHPLPNPRTYISSKGYSSVKGHTAVLSAQNTPLKEKVEVVEGDAMEE